MNLIHQGRPDEVYSGHLPPHRYLFCVPLLVNLSIVLVTLTTPSGRVVATLIAVVSTITTIILIAAQQKHVALRLSDSINSQAQLLIVRERSRLAIDLHDTVTQLITATNLLADSISPDTACPDTNSKLDRLRIMTAATHAAIRHLLLGLHPADIIRIPLEQLITELIDYRQPTTVTPITYQCYAASSIDYPAEVHYALYRIIDLALSNSITHSCASWIQIFMRLSPDQAIISIEDDGIGFDFNTTKIGHYGLTDIKTHAQHIGASLDYNHTKPGPHPKRITCTWRRHPCHPSE